MYGVLRFLVPLAVAASSVVAGQSWTPILPSSSNASAVVVHPLDPRVLALTWLSEVSFDGGQTWEALGEGVRNRAEFAFDPNDSKTWYLISWGDVDDPGKRLVRVTLGTAPIVELVADRSSFAGGIPASVAVHPHDSHVIYVGTSRGTLFRSRDRGVHWQLMLDAGPADSADHDYPLAQILLTLGSAVVVNNPIDPTTYYRSSDGGATWALRGANLNGRALDLLAVLPDDPEVLYVSAHGPEGDGGAFSGLLQTWDGGTTWRQLLRATTVTAFAVDRGLPLRLAVGVRPSPQPAGQRTSAVLCSEDGGAHWDDVSIPSSAVAPGADEAISLAFAGARRLVATTKLGLFSLSLSLPLAPTSVRAQSWARIKCQVSRSKLGAP